MYIGYNKTSTRQGQCLSKWHDLSLLVIDHHTMNNKMDNYMLPRSAGARLSSMYFSAEAGNIIFKYKPSVLQ